MRGEKTSQRRRFAVAGQVQGVGFRPFVYRLAVELGLTGWVVNDSRGVTIEVQGRAAALDDFHRRLLAELPPLAEIARCEVEPAEPIVGEKHFEIAPSEGGELADAQVTVDTATCADCLREMDDPADPRYGYPFINCTNCGPRYTIVSRIPYDRPNTTMSDFAMCSLCGREYADPADRRFHAQPVACPRCGPAVWLVDTRGRQISCEDAVAEAARMLLAGRIVAIKGLGGFHIACRADDEHVLVRLRRRKRRDAKPFAIMVADLPQAETLAQLGTAARELLSGPLRPILLLPKLPDAKVARSLTGALDTLGIMLPYTPLHHLLFKRLRAAAGGPAPPMVMTSGNFSEEPLVKDNDAAIAHLGRIADAILLHNRRIERRVDDSVVQLTADGRLGVMRRARGYAPEPVRLASVGEARPGAPAILAVGAELRNTICLYRDGRAVLSEHIGDLKDGRAYRHFIDTINHLEALFEVAPELVAADAHPQYLASEYAARRHSGDLPGRRAVPLVRVQHHHAHIVSCLAENGFAGDVIGLACDGVGYGDDGAVWGCEVLRAGVCDYERLGHLRYIPLIGGDAAARQTWRPAAAALHDAFGEDWPDHARRCGLAVSDEQAAAACEMLAVGVNCPPASSLGRWFDAIAALCGLAAENRFEGEAPMTLEAAVERGVDECYSFTIVSGGPFLIDLRPLVEEVVADLASKTPVPVVAAKFHNSVAAFLLAAARRARQETNLTTVALSGGCFANRYLTARLASALACDGFEVLRHNKIPCNDGGVSLGQAVVAARKALRRVEKGVYTDLRDRWSDQR
ncbi:MAG: carbamoyltransferase HypF [Planctomycetota bacterium]|jgi:hydrogenase maturation protein HypF